MNNHNIPVFSFYISLDPNKVIDPKAPDLYKVDGYKVHIEDATEDFFVVASQDIIKKHRKGNYLEGIINKNGVSFKAQIIEIFEVYHNLDTLIALVSSIEIDISSPSIKHLFLKGTEEEKTLFRNNLLSLNYSWNDIKSESQDTILKEIPVEYSPFVLQILLSSLYALIEASVKLNFLNESKQNELNKPIPNKRVIKKIDKLLEELKYVDSVGKVNQDNFDIQLFKQDNNLFTPVSNNELVKVSLHSQLQKQGKNNHDQNSIFDIIENETDQTKKLDLLDQKEEYHIEVVGLDLTKSQEKALFAIQTMLNKTNYNGNVKGRYIESIAQNFEGNLPSLQFTPAEYLEAFGVNKFESGRGKMEFSKGERDEALKALRDLSLNRYLISYERKYFSNKHNDIRSDIIRSIRPLINITEGFTELNRTESEIVKTSLNNPEINEKLKYITIEPNPVLIDQIDNYFVLKPANCYQEIQLLVGNSSKFVHRFIDYLLTEVAQRNRKKNGMTNWEIRINYESLGTILRMDAYKKTRNWKKMRISINNCYEIAKKLDYINDYLIDEKGITKDIDILTLNPNKFQKMEEINKRREDIENGLVLQRSI